MRVYLGERPSPRAAALAQAITAAALSSTFAEDLCVVLGGDGSLLHAVHHHVDARRFLGINCGYLGFLMNHYDGEPDAVVELLVSRIEAGALLEANFPTLSFVAEGGGRTVSGFALNDVYAERETGQTCHLRVTVDGVEVVARMVCDGIIAATPLGSTAYSFSAGGPAAHPLLKAIQLTAICPHTPRLAPLMLPLQSTIQIEVLDPGRRPARVVFDGIGEGSIERVEIRDRNIPLTLCFSADHNFTATMLQKIVHP